MLVANYEFPAEAYVAVALVFFLLAFLVYVLGSGIVYLVREELRYRRERCNRLPITHGQKLRVFPQTSELIDQLKGAANGAAGHR